MKHLFFCIVSSIIVQQCLAGTVNASQSELHDKFVKKMEKELMELTSPVLTAAHNLRQQVHSYQHKYKEANVAASLTHFHINSEACQNLSNTLISAGQLAWNATIQVYDMTLNITNTLSHLTDCTGWNAIKAIKCYVDNITNAVNNFKSIKPTIVKVLHQVLSMTSKLEPEFIDCIGNGPTSHPPTTKNQHANYPTDNH